MAHAMSRIRRLERIEARLIQQERLADAEGLRELAESARAKLLSLMAMARAGVPIPASTVQHSGSHGEALRRRLSEMRERLERYAELRDTYGIR
jgi:hypothetical protein